MTIQIGDRIPDSTLMIMSDGKPTPLTSTELFGGKKVVLFSDLNKFFFILTKLGIEKYEF